MPDRLALLLRYHQEDPDDAFTRFALAREYQKLGDAAEALATFEGLVQDQPDYVGTYYHLGKLYAELGRTEDAVATLEAGIAVATAQQDAHSRSELQGALLEAQGIGFDD